MPRYSALQIASVVNGKFSGPKDLAVDQLIYDSRKTFDASNSMFIAIDGERNNGHNYIRSMYKKGVRTFLISNSELDTSKYIDAAFILVNNTVRALQQLVADYRNLFHIPIIAITGSNGKTIVKEWLATCLALKYKVTRNPKSFNSQIGVPLSVWLLNENAEWGIFEAGISKTGEMEHLSSVIAPTHGIITNIGEAHQQNFKSLEDKLGEKLLLFASCEKLYYCSDHDLIHHAITSNTKYNKKELVTWSFRDSAANLFVSQINKTSKGAELKLSYGNNSFSLQIPFTDKASLENVMHVINFLLSNGFTEPEVKQLIATLHPVAMRMEKVKGINDCTLINDAYNSDINALGIALDYLYQQSGKAKVLILSDFEQSGLENKELYKQVEHLIRQGEIEQLIAIGENISSCADLFSGIPSRFYTNTSEFIESSVWREFSNKLILIKGARGFRFEDIVNLLSEKNHTTLLETNLNNLTENLNYFRSLLKPNTGIMVMVKALAYGSGSFEIAKLLQHEKVDYLGVAFTDEGVQLRQADIHLPIMVMAPGMEDFNRIIEYELEPEIYSFRILKGFIAAADIQQVSEYPVHLKIDTGMHRLGFLAEEIDELISILKSTDTIKVKAVFSHLAGSDESAHDEFTRQQIRVFNEAYQKIEKAVAYKPLRHILNSAGIERFPEAHFEMVRLGIGLHGISAINSKLLPVSTLKTHISQIKHITAGETIGYSRKGKAEKAIKIAIIPVGYADGLDRKLGNGKAYVMVNNQKAWYIGSICMDMCMIDITDIECFEGEEIIVFGTEPSINELAIKIDTIPYEVLTNVSSRVKRVYIKD
jgi:Alr-MurF fusion protein